MPFINQIANDVAVESNSRLAADVIATIYTGYVSAEKKGKEMLITNL